MKKNTLVTGLALFAMFFGAGNLIFPPFLGMESGTDWVIGFLCFILIDVALSCRRADCTARGAEFGWAAATDQFLAGLAELAATTEPRRLP